jgi:hypothetical protein
MSTAPTQLHELLAVETALENQANKVRTDLIATFEKKRHLFEEARVTFTPLAEGAVATTETQSDLQSTVVKELAWVKPHLVKALDASFQVAEANTQARADIVLEDDAKTVLAEGVPATALLELEKRITEIGALVAAVPTLDPARGFQPDSSREAGIYAAREVVKTRTKKSARVIVKYEATKEHPAQTEMIAEDVPTGTVRELSWSGMTTPAAKAEMLARVEMVTRAVRRARARANAQPINADKRIGNSLLKFVFGS